MKRFLILFMVLGLMAGSMATADARKKKASRVERTVEANYDTSLEPWTECNARRGTFGCVVIETRSTEAFFTAKVTDDAHDQPVFVQVVNGDGGRIATFCGETTEPVPFDAGSSVEFLIEPVPHFFSHWGAEWLGPLDCPYRIATTGTISVTLSNQP